MAISQETEVIIFGQNVEVVDGYFFATNGESFKLLTPRKKVKGRHVNMTQMLESIRDMFQEGKTGSQIASLLDMDSDTIGKYKKIIMAFNALDESAIVKDREDQAEFRNEQTAKMLSRPEVNAWHTDLIENGKNKKTTRNHAACLNHACQILKISPMALCQKAETDHQAQLKAINRLMLEVSKVVTSESSFYQIRMAVRSWIQYNGVGIPRGNLCPKYLSGKIVSTHGAAKHIRASMDEIARANALLEDMGDLETEMPHPARRQDTEIVFKFGVQTANRMTAIFSALLENWNSATKIFKTIERKLAHVGKQNTEKRIFCSDLIRLINERKAAGKKCLVGEIDEYMPFHEMAKKSSDEIHLTEKHQQAKREIAQNLRWVYEQVGGNMGEKYFTKKPFHSLRHLSIQYWLLKSNFDYGFTAELADSNTIDELKTSYGGMPPEVFEKKYQKYIEE